MVMQQGSCGGGEGTYVESLRLVLGKGATWVMDVTREKEAELACLNSSGAGPATATPSLYLYAGHDYTAMPLLLMLWPEYLHRDNARWPPYCADLAFEFHRPVGEERGDCAYYIRCVYLGQPLPLTQCGGDAQGFAPLSRFKVWMAQFELPLETGASDGACVVVPGWKPDGARMRAFQHPAS